MATFKAKLNGVIVAQEFDLEDGVEITGIGVDDQWESKTQDVDESTTITEWVGPTPKKRN